MVPLDIKGQGLSGFKSTMQTIPPGGGPVNAAESRTSPQLPTVKSSAFKPTMKPISEPVKKSKSSSDGWTTIAPTSTKKSNKRAKFIPFSIFPMPNPSDDDDDDDDEDEKEEEKPKSTKKHSPKVEESDRSLGNKENSSSKRGGKTEGSCNSSNVTSPVTKETVTKEPKEKTKYKMPDNSDDMEVGDSTSVAEVTESIECERGKSNEDDLADAAKRDHNSGDSTRSSTAKESVTIGDVADSMEGTEVVESTENLKVDTDSLDTDNMDTGSLDIDSSAPPVVSNTSTVTNEVSSDVSNDSLHSNTTTTAVANQSADIVTSSGDQVLRSSDNILSDNRSTAEHSPGVVSSSVDPSFDEDLPVQANPESTADIVTSSVDQIVETTADVHSSDGELVTMPTSTTPLDSSEKVNSSGTGIDKPCSAESTCESSCNSGNPGPESSCNSGNLGTSSPTSDFSDDKAESLKSPEYNSQVSTSDTIIEAPDETVVSNEEPELNGDSEEPDDRSNKKLEMETTDDTPDEAINSNKNQLETEDD